MRAVLAIAEGVWIPIVGIAGFLVLRWRERVRLEEQGASELRRLRVDALVRFVNAVAAYSTAKAMVLGMRPYYATRPATTDTEAQRLEDHRRLEHATTQLSTVMAADGRLLPAGARRALDPTGGDLHRKLILAETQPQLLAAATEIAKFLDDYLPELPVLASRRARKKIVNPA